MTPGLDRESAPVELTESSAESDEAFAAEPREVQHVNERQPVPIPGEGPRATCARQGRNIPPAVRTPTTGVRAASRTPSATDWWSLACERAVGEHSRFRDCAVLSIARDMRLLHHFAPDRDVVLDLAREGRRRTADWLEAELSERRLHIGELKDIGDLLL